MKTALLLATIRAGRAAAKRKETGNRAPWACMALPDTSPWKRGASISHDYLRRQRRCRLDRYRSSHAEPG